MKNYHILFFLPLLFIQCKTPSTNENNDKIFVATVLHEGLVDCFSPLYDSTKNRWTFCEVSAVLALNNEVYLASDKKIPEHSSVFTMTLENGNIQTNKKPSYLEIKAIQDAMKFEDFSISPDRKHVFLNTGFDRIKDDKWDKYNTLLTWPVDDINKIQVLDESNRNGKIASLKLRDKISKALADDKHPEGLPYFKIEGLAAMPNNTLYLGVREKGTKYDNFEYAIQFLSVSYSFNDKNEIVLNDDMKSIYEFKPSKEEYKDLNLPIALSSIEYSPAEKKIYMTTSYEHNDQAGAYLWHLDIKSIEKKKAPKLIMDSSKKKVFHMNHKAEGVSILNKNQLLIVHDDDRILVDGRKPHQSAYTIVEIR